MFLIMASLLVAALIVLCFTRVLDDGIGWPLRIAYLTITVMLAVWLVLFIRRETAAEPKMGKIIEIGPDRALALFDHPGASPCLAAPGGALAIEAEHDGYLLVEYHRCSVEPRLAGECAEGSRAVISVRQARDWVREARHSARDAAGRRKAMEHFQRLLPEGRIDPVPAIGDLNLFPVI
jgi:hypothetical protein